MNRTAQMCFTYGCLSSMGVFIWYVNAFLGRTQLPASVWIVEAFFVVHAIVMLMTFHRRPGASLWAPVLTVTPNRIRIGKLLLLIAMINFLMCAVIVALHNRASSAKELTMALTSLALLNTIYIAVHWAFRPENLFPSSLLVFISNPFLYCFRRQPRLQRNDRSRQSRR